MRKLFLVALLVAGCGGEVSAPPVTWPLKVFTATPACGWLIMGDVVEGGAGLELVSAGPGTHVLDEIAYRDEWEYTFHGTAAGTIRPTDASQRTPCEQTLVMYLPGCGASCP